MSLICQKLYVNKYGSDKGVALFYEMLNLCELLHVSRPYTHLELDYIEVPRVDIPDSLDKIIADIWG